MGNRIGSTGAEEGAAGEGGNFGFNTRRRYQQHKREYCLQNEYRSKTLPARPTPLQPQKQSHPQTRLGSSSCLGGGQNTSGNNNSSTPPHNGETSRVLFLLYLIHRTWNVVMDTMDSRTKSRSPRGSTPQKETPVEMGLQERNLDEECSIGITDMDASSFCSQYSCCSCSYCDEGTAGTPTNVYSSIGDEYSLDSMFDAAKSVIER